MKILVTGGAGFIASHVSDLYIKEGHEVAILDNLSTGKKSLLILRPSFFKQISAIKSRLKKLLMIFSQMSLIIMQRIFRLVIQ